MNLNYDHEKIERKWQDKWSESGIFETSKDTKKKKKYILDMFPYPSGAGLHVGHPEGYTATDIYSRYLRFNNFSVMHRRGNINPLAIGFAFRLILRTRLTLIR